MQGTFTDFKERFYNRFPDPSFFTIDDINFIKVVLDGLKVNYAGRFPSRAHAFFPPVLLKAYLRYKRRKDAPGVQPGIGNNRIFQKKIWCVDFEAKYAVRENGEKTSLYFGRIHQESGGLTLLMSGKDDNSYTADFCFKETIRKMRWLLMNEDDRELLKKIKRMYSRISASGKLSEEELRSVKLALNKFFFDHKAWNEFFHSVKPESICFVVHYHREGFIYAMKKNGVFSVELQHGLIAPQDIFYIMPKSIRSVAAKALFADRLLVFGKYWKGQLSEGGEYRPEQIAQIGYYFFRKKEDKSEAARQWHGLTMNKKVALVCTQTEMHREYCELISRLSELNRKSEHVGIILVKPHPHEQVSSYDPIKELPDVRIVQGDLDQLLSIADVHLSVYSTTHFDSLRHGVVSYAMSSPWHDDYVAHILKSGVATLYDFSVGIFDMKTEKPVSPENYYGQFIFQPELFLPPAN